MIPRDLYKPEEEEETEEMNQRYHKHKKLPLTSNEKKAISKKKIKEKYEPKDDSEEIVSTFVPPTDFSLPSKDLGLEGLKQRLQERILSLKASRGEGTKSDRKTETKSKQQDKRPSNSKKHVQVVSPPDDPKQSRSVREELLHQNDDPEDAADVVYSKFVESSIKSSEPGKPGSKTKRLQRMLDEANKKRQRLEDLKSQGKEGIDRVRSEQWSEVIQEAAGEKVSVDTSKIKKALKRRAKNKEKSAIQWQERISELETEQTKKQEKREENILKRKRGADYVDPSTPGSKKTPEGGKKIQGIVSLGDKKEKENGQKSQRAGFEGKKSEFLNKKK